MSYQNEASPFLPEDGARWVEPTQSRPNPRSGNPAVRAASQHAHDIAPEAPTPDATHISEFRERILAELRLRAEFGDAAVGGEELGFAELNQELIVEAGRLMVVGAREGVGKTAWALQVARYIATRLNPLTGRGGTVVYYITEMSVQQTVERVVVAFAQLQMRQLKKGVTLEVVAAVEKAFDELEKSGLHIKNVAGWSVDDIVAHATAFKAENKDLRATFVDNLTGIKPARHLQNKAQWEQWNDIVDKLNTLSMTDKGIGTPVVLLAHLKRADKLHAGKEPTAQDFAGSDGINRWASILVLIHERSQEERDAAAAATAPASTGGFGGGGFAATNLTGKQDPFAEPVWSDSKGEQWGKSEIGSADGSCSHTFLVVKNRDGRRFRSDLNFIGAQMRFEDPKAKTVRPYEMPEPEPEARTEFRRRMLELGDL